MYGIVNKSIEDLVITNFGEEKTIENVAVSTLIFFISNEPYDDDITFKLAIAARK
jgi:hypothetical protein